jgi:cell division protein ZapA
VSCADGQESRIRRLAQYVDAKIGEFVATIGQVGEARLMLLASLVITDELADANEALLQERARNRAVSGEGGEGAAGGVRAMTQRIESIAARLESS